MLKAAVAERGSGCCVELEPLLVGQEHRDAGPVLALEEDLLHLVVGRLDVDFRLPQLGALAGDQVVAVDRRRVAKLEKV